MQFTIPQHMQDQKEQNIQRFPSLAIGLSDDEIAGLTTGNRIVSLTEHQKAACRMLAKGINWHPQYVAECCPASRPALLPKFGDTTWEAHCRAWQAEHDLSVADLADQYKVEFARVADRLFEPIDRHEDGVLMSAHDNTNEKYPCSVANW